MYKSHLPNAKSVGNPSDKATFGYEVAGSTEQRNGMIREAQARFASVDPDEIDAYTIIVKHKRGLGGAEDESNTVVEFAGSEESKIIMFSAYVSALHNDQKARQEIDEATAAKEQQNDR